jgi:hypothetical protein
MEAIGLAQQVQHGAANHFMYSHMAAVATDLAQLRKGLFRVGLIESRTIGNCCRALLADVVAIHLFRQSFLHQRTQTVVVLQHGQRSPG